MANPATFGEGTYGVSDDATATGIYIASHTESFSSELAQARDHQGKTVGFSVYDSRLDLSLDGVVKTASTLVGIVVGDALTSANSELAGVGLPFTGDVVVTGGTFTKGNTDFETGSLTAVAFNAVT